MLDNSQDDNSGNERNLDVKYVQSPNQKTERRRNHDRIWKNHRRAEQIDWSLLVVNVGGLDYDVPSSEEQLMDDWFLDSASLSTQIAECSADKMTFNPRVGEGINNGVMTVVLQRDVSVSMLKKYYHD